MFTCGRVLGESYLEDYGEIFFLKLDVKLFKIRFKKKFVC